MLRVNVIDKIEMSEALVTTASELLNHTAKE